jgi:multidrug efflux pump subunit AcrB
VDAAKGDLPKEAEEPIISEVSLAEKYPVLVMNLVAGQEIALSELKDLAERIQDEFEAVPGVLDVKVAGGRDREILIEVDPERLHHYQLTLASVEGVLRGSNRNVSAGAAVLPANRLVMRAPGEFRDPSEIFNLVVGVGNDGTPIYMRDVASVRYDFADETSRARVYDFAAPDGETSSDRYVEPTQAISIMVIKKTGANVLELVDACRGVADNYALPEGVELLVVQDLSKEVRMVISELENGIGTSLILVLAVILIGLGVRNAFLVAWAIPFSMLLTIICLSLFGFTLNNMILYSLILALGMLVDNAIVIVENIYRHQSMGESRPVAALKGTSEVVMTVLLCSLFVALVINPTLCSLFMKVKKGAQTTVDPESERPTYPLAVRYGGWLETILDRPLWTLATAFAMLVMVMAVFGVAGLGAQFMPDIDPNRLIVSITPPDGSSIDETDRLSRAAEDRLFGRPGSGYDAPVQNLKQVGVTLALQGGEAGGPGALRLEFVDREYRTEVSTATLTAVRNRIEGLDDEGNVVTHPLYGADYDVLRPQEGPPTGKPVSVDIFGKDLGEMTRVVYDMKELMSATPGVAKPTDDAATSQPTLEWRVDKARAGMVGLEQASVSAALEMVVGGRKVGTFGHGDDEQDIVVRLPEEYRTDTRRIKTVTIPAPGGGAVPISSVATAELVPGPVQIKHLERKRVLNAGAEVQPWVKGDAVVRADFQERVGGYTFPPGITHAFGGAAEDQEESTAFLKKAFMIALFLIAMVLVVQFNSVLVPAIIMCSVVLSLIGVFLGLLFFRLPFGIIMSGIGVISLAGIVVNNGIVLLDAIRQFQARGLAVREAVVTASMIRLRPVLLTAITTILGLVPMAAKLNIDFFNAAVQYNTESSQWWQSMAVVVIVGLLVATVLTLGVVPALYLLYDRFIGWLRAKVGISPSARLTPLE